LTEATRCDTLKFKKKLHPEKAATPEKENAMKKGDSLVIVGCGGVGAPAAMLSRKLMPDIKITVVREERTFIVR